MISRRSGLERYRLLGRRFELLAKQKGEKCPGQERDTRSTPKAISVEPVKFVAAIGVREFLCCRLRSGSGGVGPGRRKA